MAAAAAVEVDPEAEVKALREVMNKAKIAAPLVAWLTETEGMESVTDFFHCFKKDTYEDEIDKMLQKTDDFKDQPVQTARCRAAWRATQMIVEAQEKPPVDEAPTQDDLDLPLSDTIKQELDKLGISVTT